MTDVSSFISLADCILCLIVLWYRGD